MKNKIVVITGASSGIGKATAIRLSSEGHSLVLAARRIEKLETLKEQLEKENTEIVILKTDVTKRDDVKRLIKTTFDKFGRIDVLINNAGIMPLSFIEEGRVEN